MPRLKQVMHLILQAFADNREAWPFALPVGMGIGIVIYFSLFDEPSWFVGPLALVVLGCVTAALSKWRGGPAALALVATFIALGFGAASLRTHSLGDSLLPSEPPATVIEGRIVEYQPYDKGARITLDRVHIAALARSETPKQVRIRLRGDQPDLAAGEWVRLWGKVSPPSAPLLPGGFDFQRHAYFSGLGAVGFSMGRVRVLDGPPPGPFEWRIHLSNLRTRLAERVMAAIPGDAGAVASALITGHRSLIPEPVLEAFRQAGLAHLLAISGLHIGLAAGIVFLGARRLMGLWPAMALRLPVKKLAALAALAAAFGYSLMAGATVPTQRAFLIAGMILIAVMVDRRGISLRMLAWGAAVILLLQPESLLGPSFQMSFAAALALVAGYEAAKGRGFWRGGGRHAGHWLRGVALYAGGVAFTTVNASLATAPFVLYHFNEVARFGLLANMVAVPVTALWVMPAAMASFLLMPFGIEQLALIPMGWGTQVVIATADWVSSLPQATEILPSVQVWALGALAIGGVWLCVIRTRIRFAGLAGIVVFAAAHFQVSAPDLIVAADGELAAVRGTDGTYSFSSLRRDRFTRENWLAHVGLRPASASTWTRDGGYVSPAVGSEAGLRCDVNGCVLKRGAWTVSISENRAALTEDCGVVDLVVSLVPASRVCKGTGTRVIDIYDLRRQGAHSISLDRDIRVEAVNQGRGNRPWVVHRKSWKPKPE